MKLLINVILAVVVLTLFSCESKDSKMQRELIEKAKQDSIIEANSQVVEKRRIALEKERNKEILEKDSLAIYAWGDAKFGMTRKEVLQTTAFRKGRNCGAYIEMAYDMETALLDGIGLKNHPEIRAYFDGKDDNELSRVVIEAYTYDVKYFDWIILDAVKYIEEFTKKYGEPDNEMEKNYRYFSSSDIRQRQPTMIASWSFGVEPSNEGFIWKGYYYPLPEGVQKNGIKHIMVYLKCEEKYSHDKYSVEIRIGNTCFPRQKKELSEVEKQEISAKEQRQVDAVNYSF